MASMRLKPKSIPIDANCAQAMTTTPPADKSSEPLKRPAPERRLAYHLRAAPGYDSACRTSRQQSPAAGAPATLGSAFCLKGVVSSTFSSDMLIGFRFVSH